jgi:hypothetical protein
MRLVSDGANARTGKRIMTDHELQAGFVPEIDWQALVFWALLISTASGAALIFVR